MTAAIIHSCGIQYIYITYIILLNILIITEDMMCVGTTYVALSFSVHSVKPYIDTA